MAAHDAYYKAVAEEISRRHIDKATWTRAFAESGGDQAVAKSLYCRYRAEQLAAASQRQARQVRTSHAKHHGMQLLWSIIAFVVGVAITGVSYSAASPGGHYIAATGLMFGGFYYACKSLVGIARAGVGSIQPTR